MESRVNEQISIVKQLEGLASGIPNYHISNSAAVSCLLLAGVEFFKGCGSPALALTLCAGFEALASTQYGLGKTKDLISTNSYSLFTKSKETVYSLWKNFQTQEKPEQEEPVEENQLKMKKEM